MTTDATNAARVTRLLPPDENPPAGPLAKAAAPAPAQVPLPRPSTSTPASLPHALPSLSNALASVPHAHASLPNALASLPNALASVPHAHASPRVAPPPLPAASLLSSVAPVPHALVPARVAPPHPPASSSVAAVPHAHVPARFAPPNPRASSSVAPAPDPCASSRVAPVPAPHIPLLAATSEPQFTYRSWFTGALLPVCGVEILIVVVHPRIMFDVHEANLYVTAFHLRFRRTVVLVSQAELTFVPTYYGPAGIVQVLSRLPFDVIPWQRLLYRTPKRPVWKLPIPPERPPEDSDDASSAELRTDESGCPDSSRDDLSHTRIRDRDSDELRAIAERMARSTRR